MEVVGTVALILKMKDLKQDPWTLHSCAELEETWTISSCLFPYPLKESFLFSRPMFKEHY